MYHILNVLLISKNITKTCPLLWTPTLLFFCKCSNGTVKAEKPACSLPAK